MSILENARKTRAAMIAAAVYLDDATASTAPDMFPRLKENGELVKVGTRINWNGVVKKSAVDLWDTAENNPDNAPALWARVLIEDPDTAPAWVQPDSTNPYAKGDRVTHKGHLWESEVDSNVWEPGVYGWKLIE